MAEFKPIAPVDSRTLVDGNQDVFRYGLQKFFRSEFEDPTYIGFTIELDESNNSPLFNGDLLAFLERHADINPELKARIPLYHEFVDKIRQIYNSQESVQNPQDKGVFIKQHYINSITGLDALQHKFVNLDEDRLSIELYEDLSMFSTYVAHLYNNLVYGYANGRQLIPDNLLFFNMFIKMSEIRNLTSLSKAVSDDPKDIHIINGLKHNVTSVVYKLNNCNFDFFQSKPFEDTITQAGIDAAYPGASIVNHEIRYRNVDRQIYNPLIENSITFLDGDIDLNVVVVGSSNTSSTGQTTDPSKNNLSADGEPYQASANQSTSTYENQAFTNQGNKKPSAYKTYNAETTSDNKDSMDLDGLHKYITRIKDENYVIDLNSNVEPTNVQEPTIEKAKKTTKEVLKSAALAVENQAISRLKVAEKAILTKIELERKNLFNTFIHDLGNQVGIKEVLKNSDNVYTNYNLQSELDSLHNSIGKSLTNEVISLIKANASSNILPNP